MNTRSTRPPENNVKKKTRFVTPEVRSTRNIEESDDETEKTVKRGPPVKKRMVERVKPHIDEEEEEDELDEEDLPVPVKRTKEIPYVSVPPLSEVYRPKDTPRGTEEIEIVKAAPAYRTRAPIEDYNDPEEIGNEIMDIMVTLPWRKVVAVSPNLRDFMKKNLTKVRKALVQALTVSLAEPETPRYIETGITGDLPLDNFMYAADVIKTETRMEPNWKVGADPYLQFAQSHNGALPKEPCRARDTSNLRVLFPKINNIGQEEAILDSGSQIVSMSEAVATELGLTWNPAVTINMQSANQSIDRTLGLAENVPFNFGGVVVYLQVHILKSPAYRVLLGQPFNLITTSVVTTHSDNRVNVLVTDPNTGQQANLPAYERGKGPEEIQKEREAQSF